MSATGTLKTKSAAWVVRRLVSPWPPDIPINVARDGNEAVRRVDAALYVGRYPSIWLRCQTLGETLVLAGQFFQLLSQGCRCGVGDQSTEPRGLAPMLRTFHDGMPSILIDGLKSRTACIGRCIK
jgi:hypothetical protein